MTDTYRPVLASGAANARADVLAACARSASALTDARLGVAYLAEGVASWWSKDSSGRPSSTGPIAAGVLPTMLSRIRGPVVADDLADSALVAGLSTWDLEGLASAAVVPVLDSAGRPIGLVGAFDRFVRRWQDEDVEHLLSVAELVSERARSMERLAAASAVARAAGELELCVNTGSLHALVDAAGNATEPTVRRRASEALTLLDRAAVLAGRLRSSLQSQSAPEAIRTGFDLVAVVGHATSDAGSLLCVKPPHVHGVENSLPVAGDGRRAHAAILRAVSAALAVAPPEDTTIVTGTRGAQLATLEGSVVAQVAIDVRGASLGAADLSRVAAALFDEDLSGAGPIGLSLSISGSELRLVAPGVEAMAAPAGTRVVLSWTVDLG